MTHTAPVPGARIRKSSRNHQFDLMRIVFATLVLLSHAPEITDGNASRELLHRLTRGHMSFGTFAVDGFFLLSGFLIVQSWDRDPEFLNFLKKRVLRIVPGYLVAVFLSVLVVGWLAPAAPGFFSHLGLRFAVSILLLSAPETPPVLPGVLPPLVNGSLWTILYEFRCYLLVGLLGMAGVVRRRTLWLVATVLFSALAYVQALEAHFEWSRYKFLTGEPLDIYRFTAAFFWGGSFYLYRERIRFLPPYAVLSGAVVIAGLLLRPQWLEPILVVFGGYLLFYFAHTRLRALGFMQRVPDISYGIYLYGWPVEGLWIYYRHGSPWVTFGASVVICAVIGWLSWQLVERPMLRSKRRTTAPLPL